MILEALDKLYERYPAGVLPPEGYADVAISFLIVIDRDGGLVNLADIREGEGKKRHGKLCRVPQSSDRTGQGAWQTAFLLWDHPRYVLGIPPKDTAKEVELAPKRMKSFIDRIRQSFPDTNMDDGIAAVLQFYEGGGVERVKAHPRFQDLLESNGNIAFQLVDDAVIIAQRSAVVEQVTHEFQNPFKPILAPCLVSGQVRPVSRLHPATPIQGSQSTAKIHSFNLDAFNSYGKSQGSNAPVSEISAFRYTTALNYLLGSKQQLRVGDTTTVFWAEEQHQLETAMVDLFGEPPKDNPNKNTDAVKVLYSAVQAGTFAVGGLDTRFHVLGLAPNAARISIRFWETATAGDLARRIKQHFDDLAIVHADYEPEYLSLFRLLTGIALLNKADNIPPNLGGELMRAILEGLPYPKTLLNLAVARCRAEQARKDQKGKSLPNVSHPRAAVIKASLNRLLRSQQTTEREYLPMPDPSNPNPAYRLGRLFATLERIQEDAAGGHGRLNATIRDRYYGAASSTPAAVFSTLLRLEKHHIGKLPQGLAIIREKLVGEIMEGFDPATFPPRHLALPDQARFALGYYQQRQAFFAKSEPNKTPEETQ